jgi:hypothetical protein
LARVLPYAEKTGVAILGETNMNERRSAVLTGVVTLCVLIGFLASGCITSRSDVSYGPKGAVVGSSTLRKIKIGQTSKEWLLGTLGEPTRETRIGDGREILRYEYTKKVDNRFELGPFFDSRDKREESTVYCFEIADGVVARFWKE